MNRFLTIKHIVKKLICNPKQALHYMNPYKISRVFYYLRHDGLTGVSRILDDRLLMGSDLKLELHVDKLINGETVAAYPQIEFPVVEHPLVSIIIPVYNQFSYTYNCLRALYQYSQGIAYEVIIADDCSTDLTTQIVDVCRNVRVIKTEENCLFLKNCNYVAQFAKGKYLLFLNNDTQVQKNWLKPLVDLMEQDESIGMTGSKFVYPDGTLQECGGILWKDGSAWNYGHGKNPALPEFCYVKECDYISGASIMIRKALWKQLGGFDIRFAPAYCEDSDLAFQVRQAGYRVVLQPKSVVVHFEGKSNGTSTDSGIKAYQVENQRKFYEKWGPLLEADHLPNGEAPYLTRDRSQLKKKILVIDHKVPLYDNDAGARTVFMYLKLYLKMGLSVTYMPDNYFPNQPYTAELEQLGIEVLYGNYYFAYHDAWLREHAQYFDYFMLNRPHISVKHIDLILENRKPDSTLIYYGHDLHFLRERREYEVTGNEEHLRESERWEKLESELIRKSDIAWVVGLYEKEILKEKFPDKQIEAIPIFTYEPIKEPDLSGFHLRKNLLFVGGFGHPPNIDAVCWFAREVFPLVQREIPDVEWTIVGSNPTEEVMKFQSDKIHVLGFVPDATLKRLYGETRLVVVPLRFGAGVKGKVVEAVYYQTPMLTTPIGAEGISTAENAFAVAPVDAEEFARAIVWLYTHDAETKEMLKNSVNLINEHYTDKQAYRVVAKCLGISPMESSCH